MQSNDLQMTYILESEIIPTNISHYCYGLYRREGVISALHRTYFSYAKGMTVNVEQIFVPGVTSSGKRQKGNPFVARIQYSKVGTANLHIRKSWR
ncbi:hypothetical protein CHS0354_011639 [Potamilus streckersoni]|uniref:Uncharacterized protein n=1 Tax=Potamilus streckersoni TaxID=2493646 RepID=A0AAE0TL98_9BIVA|nr:hypothetical protein CHS0354_011639 [Potamilus streckersoni]